MAVTIRNAVDADGVPVIADAQFAAVFALGFHGMWFEVIRAGHLVSLIMAILTVRLTADEERLLAKRSCGAGMKKAAPVRQLIREDPFVTGVDVAKDAERRKGDARLRTRTRRANARRS
jgi:hypothetical protein